MVPIVDGKEFQTDCTLEQNTAALLWNSGWEFLPSR